MGTQEIRKNSAIGPSSGGKFEESLAVWGVIGLGNRNGVDVVVVSSVNKGIPKNKQRNMLIMVANRPSAGKYEHALHRNRGSNSPWEVDCKFGLEMRKKSIQKRC